MLLSNVCVHLPLSVAELTCGVMCSCGTASARCSLVHMLYIVPTLMGNDTDLTTALTLEALLLKNLVRRL